MKKYKKYIVVIVILVLLLLIQLIYNNTRINVKKEEEKLNNKALPIESYSDRIIIENIDEAFANYSGNITEDKLRESIITLALTNLDTIRNDTKDKTISENENYYNKNEIKISNMGIQSKEEFLLISEDINNLLREDNILLKGIKLSSMENSDTEDGYYKLYLTLDYNNGTSLNLKCYLSITDNTIMYLSNSQIAKLFEKYKGPIGKIEFISTIENFKNSVEWIIENTKQMSINKQLKFYSDNEEKFKEMGVNTKEDFNNISREISNNVNYKKSSALNYCLIDFESYKTQEQYDTFYMKLVYDYTEQLSIIVSLANNNNSIPRIIISGPNGDE